MARVLVLGGASWNRMIYAPDLPAGRSETIFDASYADCAGSTGIGKALTALALGHEVQLHCVLGADGYATQIRDFAKLRGLELIVDVDPDHPTPHHVNLMDAMGQRVSYLLENGSANPPVDRHRLAPLIAGADVVFASITGSTRPVLDLVEHAGAPVQVDLHDWDGANPWHRDFIAVADFLQVSQDNLSDPVNTCQHLLQGRAHDVVLTKAGQGAEVFLSTERHAIPPRPAKLVDSNGAGDAFAVAYTLARCDGMSPQQAGAFAAEIAAQVVESAVIIPPRFT